jgi:hypothetical protein
VNSYSGNVNTYSGKSAKVFTFKPESVFTLNQNRCSRSARNTVHVGPEYAPDAIAPGPSSIGAHTHTLVVEGAVLSISCSSIHSSTGRQESMGSRNQASSILAISVAAAVVSKVAVRAVEEALTAGT